MSVEVDTTEYEFSHGKKPRGRGGWGFEVNGAVVWAPCSTYGDAVKWARAQASAVGARVVKVCP